MDSSCCKCMQEHVLLLDDDWFTCIKLAIFNYQDVNRIFGLLSVFMCPACVGSSHSYRLLSCLRRLHNRSVRLTCDLHKYDHVSNHRERLGWLPVDSFVRYHSLLTLFQDYYTTRSVPFNPNMRPDVLPIIYQQFFQGQNFVRDIFNTKCHLGGIVYLQICFRTFLSSVAVLLII